MSDRLRWLAKAPKVGSVARWGIWHLFTMNTEEPLHAGHPNSSQTWSISNDYYTTLIVAHLQRLMPTTIPTLFSI